MRRMMALVAVGGLLLLIFGAAAGCLNREEKPREEGIQLLTALTAPMEVPGDLAWDGEALWVVDIAGEYIYRVSPVDGRVLSQVRLPGLGVLALGVTWDGEALWAVLPLDGRLYRLDPRDGRVLAQVPLPGREDADPRALAWDGRTLWLLDGAELVQIAPQDGRVLRRLAVPTDDPQGLAWDGDGNGDGERFWMIARAGGRLERLALAGSDGSLLVEAAWPLPPPITAPAGLVGIPGEFWLSDEGSGALFRLRLPPSGKTFP